MYQKHLIPQILPVRARRKLYPVIRTQRSPTYIWLTDKQKVAFMLRETCVLEEVRERDIYEFYKHVGNKREVSVYGDAK